LLSYAKSLLFVKAGATVADFPLKREWLEREREREREICSVQRESERSLNSLLHKASPSSNCCNHPSTACAKTLNPSSSSHSHHPSQTYENDWLIDWWWFGLPHRYWKLHTRKKKLNQSIFKTCESRWYSTTDLYPYPKENLLTNK
jgi:hypothetical protein